MNEEKRPHLQDRSLGARHWRCNRPPFRKVRLPTLVVYVHSEYSFCTSVCHGPMVHRPSTIVFCKPGQVRPKAKPARGFLCARQTPLLLPSPHLTSPHLCASLSIVQAQVSYVYVQVAHVKKGAKLYYTQDDAVDDA